MKNIIILIFTLVSFSCSMLSKCEDDTLELKPNTEWFDSFKLKNSVCEEYLTNAKRAGMKPYLAAVVISRFITYKSDLENYGVAEHFASPMETENLGSGDCEDMAIWYCAVLYKYYGISDTKLTLTKDHAVAIYKDVVLDIHEVVDKSEYYNKHDVILEIDFKQIQSYAEYINKEKNK